MYMAVYGVPETVEKGNLYKRFQKIAPGKRFSENMFLELGKHTPSPRMLKCHCSLSLLPINALKTSKVSKGRIKIKFTTI